LLKTVALTAFQTDQMLLGMDAAAPQHEGHDDLAAQ
jgi:hypothetical protein